MVTSPTLDAAALDPELPPVTDSGRRDRKKVATRRAIRTAALQLVAARGFAHVTIEDIAFAADIAPRTFFNYFPTKESAVIGTDPERIVMLSAHLLARPPDETPVAALRAVLIEYSQSIEESIDELGDSRSAWFQRFSIVREDRDLRGAYVRHVSDVERGITAAMATRLGIDAEIDAYPALVTATLMAASRVAALQWSADGGVGPLAVLTAAAIDAVAGGLTDSMVFSAITAGNATRTPERTGA